MNIYCLLVSYNQEIDVNNLRNAKNNGFLPVVFDNSTDVKIREKNKKLCLDNEFKYETKEDNFGLPKAYNFVINKYLTDEDWIVLLDQDTLVSNEYYKKAKETINNGSALAYFAIFKYGKDRYGPKIIKSVKKDKICKVHQVTHLNDFLIGINSCSVFSKKVFNKVGLFNEKLFLDYVDNDICFRMATNGIKSETIDIVIKQRFFSKEENTYSAVKKRYQNQKYDGKVFYKSNYFSNRLIAFLHYHKEVIKFSILYSKHNSVLWFVPLLLLPPKSIKERTVS